MNLSDILLVALGGALGAVSRFYMVSLPPLLGSSTWNTAAVNLIGCFAMGVIYVVLGRLGAPAGLQRLLMAGFLGGFTTYSAFALDTVQMCVNGNASTALAYWATTALGAPLMCAAGYALTSKLL